MLKDKSGLPVIPNYRIYISEICHFVDFIGQK